MIESALSCGKFRPMPLSWISTHLHIDRSSSLLADHPSSALLLDRLERRALLDAAICLAAHALPAREAVWWACRCAAHTCGLHGGAPDDAAAAQAAEAWVRKPDSPRRAQAYAAAQRARFQSAEALTALAPFWAGAETRLSLRVEAAAQRLGGTVENAVRIAGFRGLPAARAERLHQFLASARDIAQGGAGHLPAAGEI